MSEELIKWLEEKADCHDMDAELWPAGSEEAENERLEAIKYRQCARQLAEAQKVEGTALEGRWYKHTEVYAPDGESWKEKYEAAQGEG